MGTVNQRCVGGKGSVAGMSGQGSIPGRGTASAKAQGRVCGCVKNSQEVKGTSECKA